MIYIVLRSGKVLQYNEAGKCIVDSGTITLQTMDGKYLIARLPLDVVERAEWSRPCAIYREVKDLRRRRKY